MSQVLNIAHRGFTKNYPDNTLEAFDAAIKLGVDGIECDVHETADSRFIIFHNDDIDGRPIAEMKMAEIRKIRLRGQYKIPTLEETLETCRQKVKLNLEIKLVYSTDKFLNLVKAGVEPDGLILSSFHGALITELADAAPDIPRGILTAFQVKDPITLIRLTRAQIMLPRFSFTTMALVDKLHLRKFQLIVWDCNSERDLRTAIEWDVDGIITDNPDLLAQALHKEPKP
jgi:glycerophosphoryl diester phosphodiesterase